MKSLIKEGYSRIASISLLLTYLPGALMPSIWSDDYPTLIDPESHQIHASRDGRPVYGLALQFFFGLIKSPQDLWLIRVIALIGLLLLAYLVIHLLNPKKDNIRIYLSTIGAFSIASFQLSIHWATAFFFPWVAYFALLGFMFIIRNSWRSKTLGIFFLTLSSLSYPILVFFIIPVVFLMWFESDQNKFNLIRNLIWSFFGIAMSVILSLVVNLIQLGLRNLTFNDRVSVVSISDLQAQSIWFLSRPVVLTFRAFLIESPGVFSASLSLLVVSVIIFYGFHLKYNSLIKTISTFTVLILFDVMSLAPLFFPNQQQIDMRYIIVGAWLITYVFISSIFLIASNFAVENLSRIKTLTAICLIFFFFASVNFRYFSIIRPIYSETHSFISGELDKCSKSEIEDGVFILQRTSSWPSREYIGMFSQVSDLASPWVPLNAVKVQTRQTTSYRNLDIPVSWTDKASSGCIIDLNNYFEK